MSHVGRLNRFGEPLIDHVERVAAAVPEDHRAIALLHEVLEWTDTSVDGLIAQGLTPLELAVIDLLTRADGESYEAHARRVAHANGAPGRAARRVKLADLEDHLAHPHLPDDAPPYTWARLYLLTAQARRGDHDAHTPDAASDRGLSAA